MREDTYDRFFRKRRKEALERAWATRNFEIELYWKRAGYFWTIIGALFAAYGLVSTSDRGSLLVLPVACLGLVMSVAWYMVNRASSAWQRNWETHIDLLEDDETGPLYKTVVDGQKSYSAAKLLGPLDVSPSKVSNVSSLFVVVTWIGLVVTGLPEDFLPMSLPSATKEAVGRWFILSATLAAVLALGLACRTGRKPEAVHLRLRQRYWP